MKTMKKAKKLRVDELLVSRSIVEDLKSAQTLVMAGNVFVRNDHKVTSPASKVAEDEPFRIKSKRDHPWVSRGGLKLSHALEQWPEVKAHVQKGAVAIDVGSSTGGFTDVLLSAGAKRVYAVDVGRGILDWRLRTDPRVVVKESCNARTLSEADLLVEGEDVTDGESGQKSDSEVTIIVCDASFIRLATVLPAAMYLCGADGGMLVALVKPQFEAKREDVEAGGVVRDTAIHDDVCRRARDWVNAQDGWAVVGVEPSPIQGPAGNVEFLLFATKSKEPTDV